MQTSRQQSQNHWAECAGINISINRQTCSECYEFYLSAPCQPETSALSLSPRKLHFRTAVASVVDPGWAVRLSTLLSAHRLGSSGMNHSPVSDLQVPTAAVASIADKINQLPVISHSSLETTFSKSAQAIAVVRIASHTQYDQRSSDGGTLSSTAGAQQDEFTGRRGFSSSMRVSMVCSDDGSGLTGKSNW